MMMKVRFLSLAVCFCTLSAQAEFLTAPVSYSAELRAPNSPGFGSAWITFDPATKTLSFDVDTFNIHGETLIDVHRASDNASILQLADGIDVRVTGSGDIERFATGSLQPSDLIALADPTSASGYFINVHTALAPAGEIHGTLAPAQELDIPVAGHVTNGIGQTFISDVRIFNRSSASDVAALVEFFPAGVNANATAASAILVNVPPRATAVLNDIAGVTGFNANGIGAIRISSATNVIATSRVYVNTANGSFGQFVPALPREGSLRDGAITQIANNSASRANIGFFNPNTTAATATLQLRDANGALLGQNAITIEALSQQQNPIAVYFPGADVANANLTLSYDSSEPVFVYAAEVDNQSGDSFLIPAQQDLKIDSQ